MEIRRKFNKSVEYRTITYGDCFTLSGETDTIYMRTSPIIDGEGNEWNAVRLYDGDMTTFNDFHEVIPIDGVFEID